MRRGDAEATLTSEGDGGGAVVARAAKGDHKPASGPDACRYADGRTVSIRGGDPRVREEFRCRRPADAVASDRIQA